MRIVVKPGRSEEQETRNDAQREIEIGPAERLHDPDNEDDEAHDRHDLRGGPNADGSGRTS